MKALAALAALSLFIAVPAGAADEKTETAKRHFKQAQTLYQSGQYTQALESFQSAYQLRPLPGFLFNMAQCHMETGSYSAAIDHYERYLAERPNARNRSMVQERLKEARTKVATSTAKALPQPPPPPLAQVKPPTKASPAKPGPRRSKAQASTATTKAPEVAKAGNKKADIPRVPDSAPKPSKDTTSRGPSIEVLTAVGEPPPVAMPPTAMQPLSIEDHDAFYETWWFWSVTSSVVAASVGAVLYATHSPDEVVVLPEGTLGRVDLR